ncbi:MAG: amidohydrolase family protein [Candidatus Hydrogenedentales bacterium]
MSDKIIIRGQLLAAGHRDDGKLVDIAIDNGRVQSIKPAGRARADIGDRETYLAPPLFDIQVNGAFGIDLLSPDLRPEDVGELSRKLAAWGVGRWVPTVITAAPAHMERACRVIAEAMHDRAVKRAVPGIHLEGPHISHEDGPRGAHDKRHVRPPDLRLFDRLMKAADGHILYTTLAPETPKAIPYIRAVVKRGVAVSLGHHAADADTIRKAADAGATLCTHLGNGLAPKLDRHNNPLWPQLADDRLSISLIADGHHLPPEVLRVFARVKGPGRTILTSDAVHVAGLKPGHYKLGDIPVELNTRGRVSLAGTQLLAGSALMLLQGVVHAAAHTELTLSQAVACASTVPAKLFGLKPLTWPPRTGAQAELIVFRINERNRAVPQAAWPAI